MGSGALGDCGLKQRLVTEAAARLRGGWRCGWNLVINWVWGVTAGKWASKSSVVCFFFFWPFITCPFKREYTFPGVWMLGAQIRSGEFELPAGHQVDTGRSWVCI